MATDIEWTDETWNPTRGCSRVSPGCDNCYAMREARRHDHEGGAYQGLTRIGKRGVDWAGRAVLVPGALDIPIRWRKPRRIFVNSMSDLFHESLENEEIAAVFGVMAVCVQHTFQVLTKRPQRALEWFAWVHRVATSSIRPVHPLMVPIHHAQRLCDHHMLRRTGGDWKWPLRNVWLGVSAEDHQRAEERIPALLQTPAAVRFVSAEPLLGPIDFRRVRLTASLVGDMLNATFHPKLDWIIAGGESGNGARSCDTKWLWDIGSQCSNAGVAFFLKQLGSHVVQDGHRIPLKHRKGGDPSEWPATMVCRQFPRSAA